MRVSQQRKDNVSNNMKTKRVTLPYQRKNPFAITAEAAIERNGQEYREIRIGCFRKDKDGEDVDFGLPAHLLLDSSERSGHRDALQGLLRPFTCSGIRDQVRDAPSLTFGLV